MSAAVRSIAQVPAAIGGWSRQWLPAGRFEASLALLLALTLALGMLSHLAVARLGEEIERLNRAGVSSLQLSNEITRRTLATGLRSYQALARAEFSERSGQSLTEVEMLVDSLSRILQQNFGSDSWRLVWLQEIRAAKDAYVAVLAELAHSAAEGGAVDPALFYALSSKGDVLISKAEAFQRVLNEEIALRAREIERLAGVARAGVALATGATLLMGLLFAGAAARRMREQESSVRTGLEGLAKRLGELSATSAHLAQFHSDIVDEAASLERVLLVDNVHRAIARSTLERNRATVEANRASHEQCVHSLAQLQERVDRLTLAIRGLVGVVDQASMLALRTRVEAERGGASESKLASFAEEIGLLADRGVVSGDQIREELARVKDAADTSAASLAKRLSSAGEAAHQTESLAANFAAMEASSEALSGQVTAFQERVREGAHLRTRLVDAIGDAQDLLRQVGVQVDGVRRA